MPEDSYSPFRPTDPWLECALTAIGKLDKIIKCYNKMSKKYDLEFVKFLLLCDNPRAIPLTTVVLLGNFYYKVENIVDDLELEFTSSSSSGDGSVDNDESPPRASIVGWSP